MQSAVIDSARLSVCMSVRHSPVSCQNYSSYDHAVFTDSSFLTVNFTAKFKRNIGSEGTE